MAEELKEIFNYIQGGREKLKSAMDKIANIENKNTRRIRSELMKSMFDLRDALEELYDIAPEIKPSDFDPKKEEEILFRQSKARKLELSGEKQEAAKIYKELLQDPKASFLKESFEAGLYRCSN